MGPFAYCMHARQYHDCIIINYLFANLKACVQDRLRMMKIVVKLLMSSELCNIFCYKCRLKRNVKHNAMIPCSWSSKSKEGIFAIQKKQNWVPRTQITKLRRRSTRSRLVGDANVKLLSRPSLIKKSKDLLTDGSDSKRICYKCKLENWTQDFQSRNIMKRGNMAKKLKAQKNK